MLKENITRILKEVYNNCTDEQVNQIVNIIEKYAVVVNYDKFYVAFCFKELFQGSFRCMRNRLEVFILKQREQNILSSIEKKDLNATILLLEELFQEII